MTMYYSCLIFAILLSFPSAYGVVDVLKPNFYADCNDVEGKIREVVATDANRDICAGVIRLFFHDCFVNGCDGSVLLDDPDKLSERYSPANLGLRGFKVIDAAKDAAEKSCGNSSRNRVSCADVLAYAARDCVKLLTSGNIDYKVDGGRLDSKVSKIEDPARNLPSADSSLEELKANFTSKGLSRPEDLPALTGCHSIGRANCSSFEKRYNIIVKDEIDEGYALKLKEKCPSNTEIVVQDHVTPKDLDVKWFVNEEANKVLFFSDWVLRTDTLLEILMKIYAGLLPLSDLPDIIPVPVSVSDGTALWQMHFGSAMKRMSEIRGGDGERRVVCSRVNKK